MILAVDVDYKETDYRGTEAFVAGVAFTKWSDSEPAEVFMTKVDGITDYQPGQFFKRELPCILRLLEENKLEPECIVVDGHVYLDGYEKPGLGKYLYEALHGKCAVIGVAKERFKDLSEKFEIFRGDSKKALYVTAVGIDVEEAKRAVFSMHGEFRMPTLLKMADQVCRSWERMKIQF